MAKQSLYILVVEDDDRHAKLILKHLQESGYIIQIDRCITLSEAIEKTKLLPLDLVLLDLNLPDCTGLETYTRFRMQISDIPSIILSSLDSHELAVAAIRDGAQDYVAKDRLSPEILRRAIDYALERTALQNQIKEISSQLQNRVHALNFENIQLQRFNDILRTNILSSIESIRLFTQQIMTCMASKGDEAEKKLFGGLFRAVENLFQLIKNYGTNESNHHESIYVRTVIEEAVGILGLELDERNISVICGSLDKVYMIHKDVLRLFLTLISLILYIKHGRNVPKVAIQHHRQSSHFQTYSISYEGVDLTEQDIELMEAFLKGQSVNPDDLVSRKYQECHAIVTRYGGRIWLVQDDHHITQNIQINVMLPTKQPLLSTQE